MYYYIFEPPKESKEYERIAQVKGLLSTLGIAGEMATPSPGKDLAEVVAQAIQKRYSTIIAVGGVSLINQVAHALEPYDAVFGIIPLLEHPDITRLIGTSDWKSAAEHLKRRRWQSVQLGLINHTLCFLTPASIFVPANLKFNLLSKPFELKGRGGELVITPTVQSDNGEGAGLQVEIKGDKKEGGWLSGLFRKAAPSPLYSSFNLDEFRLECEQPLSITVAGASLAATPAHLSTQSRPLRLIVARSMERSA